ncbi:helix-turn-helix domain-containing protein [Halomonas korlensis]|uniref:AraC-type DNA-binding protein n=1 Tax=Halomonas korlensis TaxID=463301 RepID=A0A1I7IXT8_9GAMM|nr:AraC family transcriptional regulator [Halomonas korlensis]SFU77736.1 AraC-type DNA-binding protein [Halomonas korlensis]
MQRGTMIVEDQPSLPGVEATSSARRAAARVRIRHPDVLLLDRQDFQPDEFEKLLSDLADTPIVIILSPGRDNCHVQQALHAAVMALSGSADAASPARGEASVPHGGLADWQIRRIEAHIDAHLDETIHVRDLAAVTRLSLGHFAHAFKQTYGIPPLAHVTRRRLARACERMLNGDEPLSRIAQDCGFCDQSHFTRHFHRALGMAPQRWRRLHAEGPRHDPAV